MSCPAESSPVAFFFVIPQSPLQPKSQRISDLRALYTAFIVHRSIKGHCAVCSCSSFVWSALLFFTVLFSFVLRASSSGYQRLLQTREAFSFSLSSFVTGATSQPLPDPAQCRMRAGGLLTMPCAASDGCSF